MDCIRWLMIIALAIAATTAKLEKTSDSDATQRPERRYHRQLPSSGAIGEDDHHDNVQNEYADRYMRQRHLEAPPGGPYNDNQPFGEDHPAQDDDVQQQVEDAVETRGSEQRETMDDGDVEGQGSQNYATGVEVDQYAHTNTIPGQQGYDYPDYKKVPQTNFYCYNQRNSGYYADIEAGCQVFHVCDVDGRQDSFLCPRGTLFNQALFVCDWWFNVDCSRAADHYGLNARLHQRASPQATDGYSAAGGNYDNYNDNHVDH